MEQNLLINGETLGASQEGMLATELYLILIIYSAEMC